MIANHNAAVTIDVIALSFMFNVAKVAPYTRIVAPVINDPVQGGGSGASNIGINPAQNPNDPIVKTQSCQLLVFIAHIKRRRDFVDYVERAMNDFQVLRS